MRIRLGINIDHVATLRNARGGEHPSVLRAASIVQAAGADSLTIHLREDRRHIRDADVQMLTDWGGLPLNLEIAVTAEMVALAQGYRPEWCCLVPENRLELTTEGGLDVVRQAAAISDAIAKLHGVGTKVSLFITPELSQIDAAIACGADAVELHTGAYAHAFADMTSLGEPSTVALSNFETLFGEFLDAAELLARHGVGCHIGHGLDYENILPLLPLPRLAEVNIGHYLIGEAVFVGLTTVVQRMRTVLDGQTHSP